MKMLKTILIMTIIGILASCKKTDIVELNKAKLVNKWYEATGCTYCDTATFSSNGGFTSKVHSFDQFQILSSDSIQFRVSIFGNMLKYKYQFIDDNTLKLFLYKCDFVGNCFDVTYKKK